VTVSVIHLGGVLWLAAIGELSPACAYAPLGVACGIAGVSWLMWNRASFQIHWRGLPQTIRRDWYLGKWILATGVTSALTTYSMPWLLALLVGARATGVYAACAAVVCLVNPPVLGISNVLTPKTAQAFAERGCGELQHLVRRTTLVLGGAMGAFCGFAVLFGDLLLRLLFGREFSGNRQMVGVLAVGVLASFIVLAHGSALLSIERPDMNVAARAVGLLVALAAGLCLIWPFGSLGAAYSLLAGNAVAATVTRIAYGRLVCRAYEGSPP
jgi:O-antigen/teichoic acid export membrane protein